MAAGIEYFNRMNNVDVIIVARGGGALEDLLPFSEEIVVRAAANSHIPLISGVGHEPDWMLIDFAADVRAPTPTGAAEMVVPTKISLIQELDNLSHRLNTAFTNGLVVLKRNLSNINIKSPHQIIMEKSLDTLSIIKSLYDKTTSMAVSDLTTSDIFIKAAINGAWQNILINLKYIDDIKIKEEYENFGKRVFEKIK